MCGINGIYGIPEQERGKAAIERMNDALAHRGPDDEGRYHHQELFLGHRRLSIIDPSEEGRQPMQDPEGRYVLVYNGELYNHQALRERLASYPFRSRTDSEVVLAAYREWGASCLERFNGMFAFGIYDREKNELFLARDRSGIKPLYFFQDDRKFLFSSEIRGLLASEEVPRELSTSGLLDYCRYQTVHAPQTILKGVNMLLPGHSMLVTENEVRVNKYWDAAERFDRRGSNMTEDAIKKEIRKLLTQAVEKRMMSDVPYGAFLSGGVDSSIVVALMAEAKREKVRTFSIVFDDPNYDEGAHARAIAEQYGTEHHEIELKPEDLLEKLPEVLGAMDHPSGDGPNNYLVSQATAGSGISMALSGLGGDELLAGYSMFEQAYRIEDRKWVMSFPKDLRRIPGALLRKFRPSVASDKKDALLSLDYWELEYFYPLFRRMFSDRTIKHFLRLERMEADPVHRFLLKRIAPQTPGFELPYLSRISYAELHSYLANVLLRDTDQMSMAHSLEVRVPFLDHELIQFVLGIPDRVKYPRSPKRLLAEAMEGLVPRSVIDRPKMGFTLPWQSWLTGELREFSEERIQGLQERELFWPEGIRWLWESFKKGDPRVNWARVWYLIVLEDWLERYGIRTT
ncbi:MAG: asparagine synthase (glutamine-hydrolyzing) [Flavobacteriales bacterium]